MNIHIYKKRLRNANKRQRDLESKLKRTKSTHKITRRKLKRQISNIKRGKVNLREKINSTNDKAGE